MKNTNVMARFWIALVLAAVAAISGGRAAHALAVEITLENTQISNAVAKEIWFSPDIPLGDAAASPITSLDIDIDFGTQHLRLFDALPRQDGAGIGLGSMPFPQPAFFMTWELTFTGVDGDPISIPPLLANPIGGGASFLERTSGFVAGGSTHSAAPDFIPTDTAVLIHDLHYRLEFFTDASMSTPLALDLAAFTTVQARLDATSIVVGEAAQVSEPATSALFGAGLLGLVWLRRRWAQGGTR